jgi:hypothetical protein
MCEIVKKIVWVNQSIALKIEDIVFVKQFVYLSIILNFSSTRNILGSKLKWLNTSIVIKLNNVRNFPQI